MPDILSCRFELSVTVDELDYNNELNPEDNTATVVITVVDERADTNGDSTLDGRDIDALSQAIRSESSDVVFDVNGDGRIDALDRDMLLDELFAVPRGDANLDGRVSFADFLNLSASFGGIAEWNSGDFDGNGFADIDDFFILLSNYGNSGQC